VQGIADAGHVQPTVQKACERPVTLAWNAAPSRRAIRPRGKSRRPDENGPPAVPAGGPHLASGNFLPGPSSVAPAGRCPARESRGKEKFVRLGRSRAMGPRVGLRPLRPPAKRPARTRGCGRANHGQRQLRFRVAWQPAAAEPGRKPRIGLSVSP
jgi:hypothetical protein